MRTRATAKNVLWGLFQQAVLCFLGFFSRRVMLNTIGTTGVGLNALLTNVLSALTLAEMGIGTVIVYHLYRPLAQGDKREVCRLIQFYRTTYRKVAGAITGLGLLAIPFLPSLTKGVSYSRLYVAAVFLLFLAQMVCSYFFSYQRSLLSADQKQYIVSIVDLLFRGCSTIGGVLVLLLTHELLVYLVFRFFTSLFNHLALSKQVNRLYPYLKQAKEPLSPERKKLLFLDVRDRFAGKLSWTLTSCMDNLFISLLVGTVQVGLYSNYTIVFRTLTNGVNQISAAMSGSIGNLLATSSKEQVDSTLQKLLFAMYWIATFCSTCLFCLIDPFISFLFGPAMVLDRPIVEVCILNFFLMTMRIPLWNMVGASGLFKKDKYISLFGAFVNLIVSFILGIHFGMLGIFIGTTCTYATQFLLKTILFYHCFLQRSCATFLKKIGLYLFLSLAIAGTAHRICIWISTGTALLDFVLQGLASAAFPLAINTVLFFHTDSFHSLCQSFVKLLHHTNHSGQKGGEPSESII